MVEVVVVIVVVVVVVVMVAVGNLQGKKSVKVIEKNFNIIKSSIIASYIIEIMWHVSQSRVYHLLQFQ